MKTTLLLLLFLVAHADASAQGFKLKCQEKPVEVHVGENVILNCKSEPQLDLTEEMITWKFEKTEVVYMYREKGFHDEDYQDDQFRGRVHRVSGWKVSEGKLSVEISSVNESDAGVYTCSVVHVSKCTVTLTVEKEDKQTPAGAQGGNNTTTIGDSNNCTGIGIGIGIGIGVVVGAALTYLIYRKRKSLLSCIGRQRGVSVPTQDDQDDQDDGL